MGLFPKVLPRACTCHVLHLIGRVKSHGSLAKREAWKCSPYSTQPYVWLTLGKECLLLRRWERTTGSLGYMDILQRALNTMLEQLALNSSKLETVDYFEAKGDTILGI